MSRRNSIFYPTNSGALLASAKRVTATPGGESWVENSTGKSRKLARPTESFEGTLRNECLNEYVFASLAEARRIIEAWRINSKHCASALEPLGYLTRDEFAAQQRVAHQRQQDAASRPATGRDLLGVIEYEQTDAEWMSDRPGRSNRP